MKLHEVGDFMIVGAKKAKVPYILPGRTHGDVLSAVNEYQLVRSLEKS